MFSSIHRGCIKSVLTQDCVHNSKCVTETRKTYSQRNKSKVWGTSLSYTDVHVTLQCLHLPQHGRNQRGLASPHLTDDCHKTSSLHLDIDSVSDNQSYRCTLYCVLSSSINTRYFFKFFSVFSVFFSSYFLFITHCFSVGASFLLHVKMPSSTFTAYSRPEK